MTAAKRLIAFWNVSLSQEVGAFYRMGFASVAFLNLALSFPKPMSFYFGADGLLTPQDCTGPGALWAKLASQGLSAWYGATTIALLFLFWGLLPRLSCLLSFAWHLMICQLHLNMGWHVDFILLSLNGYLWWMLPKGDGARLYPAPGLRLVQIQLALIYLKAAATKIGSPSWQTGEAVRDFFISWYASWPLEIPLWASRGLSYGTILLEGVIPLLMWSPKTRRAAFYLAIALHSGIFIFSRIRFFSALMLFANLFYLWNELELAKRLLERASLRRAAGWSPS